MSDTLKKKAQRLQKAISQNAKKVTLIATLAATSLSSTNALAAKTSETTGKSQKIDLVEKTYEEIHTRSSFTELNTENPVYASNETSSYSVYNNGKTTELETANDTVRYDLGNGYFMQHTQNALYQNKNGKTGLSEKYGTVLLTPDNREIDCSFITNLPNFVHIGTIIRGKMDKNNRVTEQHEETYTAEQAKEINDKKQRIANMIVNKKMKKYSQEDRNAVLKYVQLERVDAETMFSKITTTQVKSESKKYTESQQTFNADQFLAASNNISR